MPVPASEAPVLPVLAGIAGLYIAQSVVSGLTFVALPAVMREAGLPLDRIGLTYLVMLPWLLKVLWAPSVERYRLPRSGRQRIVGIVLAGMLAAAAAVATTALVGPAAFGLLRRGARRLELGRTAPIAAHTDPIADATLRRPA
jgi:MFS transporter, putative signal transducer